MSKLGRTRKTMEGSDKNPKAVLTIQKRGEKQNRKNKPIIVALYIQIRMIKNVLVFY